MKLSFGPGAMVAAAFIGPGTVTTCALAGAQFGFALVWALVFGTVATMILQDMSVRLGVGARLGLGEALMQGAGGPALKLGVAVLVFTALAVGAAAYEAGNLAGGALGLEAAFGQASRQVFVAGLAAAAGSLLLFGGYRAIERVLVALVAVMSLAFVAAAVMSRPDPAALLAGLVPSAPDGGWLTIAALIGTTIVPYNLFLHAAAGRERWTDSDSVADAQSEARLSIGLGGIVSIMILTAAAASLFGSGRAVESAADLAASLEPAFGPLARYVVGVGLLAAGLTSAITAPLAAAYAVTELFPQADPARRAKRFKAVALAVLAVGAAAGLAGLRPIPLILAAQAANGLLLPVVAVFLLYVMNQKRLLGAHVNGVAANLAGGLVVLVAAGLGARGVARALGVWP